MADQEHGPQEAFYNNLPYQHPMIVCLCGASFEASTWEGVGALFDDHLEETDPEPEANKEAE
jgi:hypothetical protein